MEGVLHSMLQPCRTLGEQQHGTDDDTSIWVCFEPLQLASCISDVVK